MELIAVECPKCKGTVHIDKNTEKCFCMYCRTEIQVKKSNPTESSNIHHEFEAKLALAKHAEKLYDKNEKEFNDVLSAYDDVRQIGAHHALYWLSRSRFYAKGNLREFSEGRVTLAERETIIDQYTFLIDSAKEYYQNFVEVQTEKERTIAEINATFDERIAEEEKKRRMKEEKQRRIAEKEEERRIQLAEEEKKRLIEKEYIRSKNAPIRKKIIIAVVIAFLLILIGNTIATTMRQNAAEQQEIERQEAAAQREIERQEAHRQALWDSIEERIEAGYDFWDELVTWANEQSIPWMASQEQEIPNHELMDLINEYGLSGDYLSASPGIGLRENPDEVFLVLYFENLNYQEVIAELLQLDNSSEDALNDWLENGGTERLESAFYDLLIKNVDESRNQITAEPLFGKEFVSWDFEVSQLSSFENSFLHIIRSYHIQEPTREEIQSLVLEILEEKDNTEYIDLDHRFSDRGALMRHSQFASFLQVDSNLIQEDYFSISLRHSDINGDVTSWQDISQLNEGAFINWSFSYNINDNGRLFIRIKQIFNFEADTRGITRANFELIQNGMSLDEVSDLLGRQGQLSSSSDSLEIYTWQRNTIIISVTFENNVVVAKSQVGFR